MIAVARGDEYEVEGDNYGMDPRWVSVWAGRERRVPHLCNGLMELLTGGRATRKGAAVTAGADGANLV